MKCGNCGEEFGQLGKHWAYSTSCSHPKLSKKQKEVVTGLLMSDGTVSTNPNDKSNPRLQCKMINKKFLEYIDKEIFPKLGLGVKKTRTAKESLKDLEERRFRTTGDLENYNDIYSWQTRRLPDFRIFYDWYSSGEKIFPEDIKLTSKVLKYWYVGDGSYNKKNGKRHIQIAMSNERENKDKIETYFKEAGLPEPNSWNENKREDGSLRCSAVWNVSESKELLNYMGEPIKGFGYKW